jgi:polyhydroxybutyrate depolymerase
MHPHRKLRRVAVLTALLPLGGLATPLRAAPVCAATALSAGEHVMRVVSGGGERAVRLYVPAVTRAGRLPLVLDLHGSGSNGASQAEQTHLRAIGGRAGFVVAYPEGAVTQPDAPDGHFWNIPGVVLVNGAAVPAGTADDVRFIADTIDQLVAGACVDPRRVYVTGMSGGARMTSLLACTLAMRIAAAAPVDGLRAGLPAAGDPPRPDPASCQPERPVPILTFHGSDDPVNPFDGGGGSYWRYSVPAALQRWVELDGCRGAPERRRVAPHVERLRYGHCAAGAEIVLYRIDAPRSAGGGHAWPGSTIAAPGPPGAAMAPSREIDAGELMWAFFRRHRLPAAR